MKDRINDRYLHSLDIKSMATWRLMTVTRLDSLFSDGHLLIVLLGSINMTVYAVAKMIGCIEIKPRFRLCHNHLTIENRWHQQLGDIILVIDMKSSLHSIKWSDIIEGKLDCHTQVNTLVEDFFMASEGTAVLHKNGILKIPGRQSIDLKPKIKDVTSAIIIKSSKHWIACGMKDARCSIMAIVNRTKISWLTLQTPKAEGYTLLTNRLAMYSLKTVYEDRNRSVMMEVERDGCSYLVSASRSCRLVLLDAFMIKNSEEIPSSDYLT